MDYGLEQLFCLQSMLGENDKRQNVILPFVYNSIYFIY